MPQNLQNNTSKNSEKPFKSGFIPITGLPNAGKSTLLNLLCAARLSIISDKPQTTRNNILGILNGKDFQAVFVDTPGFLKARNKFEKAMEHSIKRASSEEGDAVVLLAEPKIPPESKLELFEPLKHISCPIFLAINKIDIFPEKQAKETADFFKKMLPVAETFFISALHGNNTGKLRSAIANILPEHPAYYPEDQLTDRWERFYAAEIIRDQIFRLFSMEIPYSCAVQIEKFMEVPGGPDEIFATIHVSKESHKGILIGKGGRMLKKLREKSQNAITKFLGRPALAHLTVRTTSDWQNNTDFLKENGLL